MLALVPCQDNTEYRAACVSPNMPRVKGGLLDKCAEEGMGASEEEWVILWNGGDAERLV